MDRRKYGRLLSLLRLLPLFTCVILFLGLLVSGHEITVQTILDYTPKNPLLVAIILLFLYAVKSVSLILLLGRYPRLKESIARQRRSSFCISLFLRILVFLPGDVVSLYLGATKTPFPSYFAASVLGTAPGVMIATILSAKSLLVLALA